MDPIYQERTPTGDVTYSMNPMSTPALESGTILLDKFRVVELLGVGGMGSVYRVDHLLMERQFALKCLNKFQEANASWRRFQNEAKAAHLLDHQNLLKVFEFGLLETGQPFFLMELIEGKTLADEIKRLGHLPVERAVAIFIQVAFAIAYAHERRIIHRDLKPSNIMIVPPRTEQEKELVKVVDFGIAKLTGVDEFNQQTLTKTGEVFGSPFYMSPEQCTGLPVDQRSDLYSMGCVFYETLTSAPPFMGESALATMMKHQSETQLPLKEASLGLSYPASLEKIICKLLEKDPAKRYQTADKLASDLIAVERELIEQRQALSGQTGVSPLSSQAEKSGKSFLSAGGEKFLKLAAFGLSMYLLGAGSSYFYLKEATKNSGVAPVTVLEKKYWSEVKGNKKIFHFPSVAIGGLMSDAGGSASAVDRVQVPLNAKTGFACGPEITRNPDFLNSFRTDEIYVIDVMPSPASNENVFPYFKQFTELRCLNVSGTGFSDKDLEILPSLEKLLYLNLSTTDVNCDALLKLDCVYKLLALDVSHINRADDVLHVIEKFPNLKHLALAVSGLGDSDMKFLTKNKTLKVLNLSTNSITDKGVAFLSEMDSLEWLDLSQNLVSPACVKDLKRMKNLKQLEIMNAEWRQDQMKSFEKELKESNPNLRIIFKNKYTFDAESLLPFVWKGKGLDAHANVKRIMKDQL